MIIYGFNAVREALKAAHGEVKEILVVEERGAKRGRLGTIVDLARHRGIRISFLDKKSLTHLTGTKHHQGVAARIGEFRYCTLGEMLGGGSAISLRKRTGHRLIVILDHIEDPQNLGAIIRSAEFFGAMGLAIPGARAASVTPAVVKASAGAVNHLPIAKVSNLASTVDALKGDGFWIAGSDPTQGTSLHEGDFKGIDIGLVIGNENRGISRLLKERCDLLFSIPNIGEVSSLNASVAAGVLIYEIVRQWTGG